jgi:hypothetical protein
MMSSHHASVSPTAGILPDSLTDFRHAFRLLWSLRASPQPRVTLALCISATTAIFSSVYSLMLGRCHIKNRSGLWSCLVGSEGRPERAAGQRRSTLTTRRTRRPGTLRCGRSSTAWSVRMLSSGPRRTDAAEMFRILDTPG